MGYTGFFYYVFVLVLLLFYYLFPKQYRWGVLLIGSVYFYVKVIDNILQLIIFFIMIFVSYSFAIIIERNRFKRNEKIRKLVLFFGIFFTILPLLMVKISSLLRDINHQIRDIGWLIPVGLSFYTLQMVAYLVDVYMGKTLSQKNLLKYALFASFFPQIIQGPIPRYERIKKELYEGHVYCFDNIVGGCQLILWGFCLKFLIADKSAIIVNTIFDNYSNYSGGFILIAAVFYSIQLYTDFLACTTLSRGVAALFGVHIDNNFNHPYFSRSIKEFWRNWHISLSSWLRDYIYIPLGGGKKGTLRKWLNIIITFTISGLWHGNGVKFIAWGMLHVLFQIAEDLGRIISQKSWLIKEHKADGYVNIVVKRILTFAFVMLGWIVFRAESLSAACEMIWLMVSDINPWIFWDDSIFRLGLVWKDFLILVCSIIGFIFVGKKQSDGVGIRRWISAQNIVLRWTMYFVAIWVIWIFGTYGYGYDAQSFIYGGF